MLVKESNKEKINEMIKKVEGRAKERTIDYSDIVRAIEKIEKRLRISKSSMLDIVADVDYHAQNFPNAYKWTAKSTHFTIRKKSSGWDLTSITRDNCRRETQFCRLTLTETAKQAIISDAETFTR